MYNHDLNSILGLYSTQHDRNSIQPRSSYRDDISLPLRLFKLTFMVTKNVLHTHFSR